MKNKSGFSVYDIDPEEAATLFAFVLRRNGMSEHEAREMLGDAFGRINKKDVEWLEKELTEKFERIFCGCEKHWYVDDMGRCLCSKCGREL